MDFQRLVLFLFVVLVKVRCDYELQVRLEHYKNPDHQDAGGELCCRGQGLRQLLACSCSNRFTICLEPSAAVLDVFSLIGRDQAVCPDAWQTYVTGVIGEKEEDSDNMSFKGKSLIDPITQLKNPIVLSSHGEWPGNFKLVFIVKNYMDMFEEPLVDFTATTWSIAGDNDYEKRELPGEMGRSAFLVSVRVICTNHTRGSYCNETGVELDAAKKTEKLETMKTEKLELPSEGNLEVQEDEMSTQEKKLADLNIDDGHKLLVISLSVIGGIFGVLVFVSLATFISYIMCCLKKNRKKHTDKSNASEKEPFLNGREDEEESDSRYQKHPFQGALRDLAADLSNSDDESGQEIYSEVPTNRVQQRVRSHMAESARRASLQSPGTGLYSIIRKEDLVVSTPDTRGDNEEKEAEFGRPIESGYSIITRESLSEELSDVAEVDEEEEEGKVAIPTIVVEQGGTLSRQKAEEEVEEDGEDTGAVLKDSPEGVDPDFPNKRRPRLATPPSD